MDLLTNAVESIQTGVDDYRQGTRPRLLSAVRNIHSGILLLYKEALLRKSPPNSNEVWLKAKVRNEPDGRDVGVGKKTAETWQIEERFKKFGITTDWSLLRSISDVRNDIEHYFPNITQEAIGGVLSSALLIIRDFAQSELGEEPRTLLGQVTWDAMLQVADVYRTEKKECEESLATISWESDALEAGVLKVRCANCASDLLRPSDGSSAYLDTELECRACGESMDSETFIPEAISEGLSWEAYLSMTDGNEEPYVSCPDCWLETYVLGESRCAHCGATKDRDCIRCGNEIPSSEFTSYPLCGYCEHVTSKED